MAELLYEQVIAASIPVYRTTKAEIVEEYKENYGSHWRGPLVQELQTITGMKEHNLQRRFDPSRLNDVPRSAKVKEQYRELGEKLPPMGYKAPPGGYLVTFSGWILIAGEYCENRDFHVKITGQGADDLAAEMDWEPIFDQYFQEDGLADDTCGSVAVSVEAA